MPTRVGDPQPIGARDHLVGSWVVPLSEVPSPAWRRQFLQAAHASGLSYGDRMTVASATLVFEIERSAFALACEKIDEWIALANGESTVSQAAPFPTASLTPRAPTILVVDDHSDIGPMAQDMLESAGYIVLLTADPLEALRMASQRSGDIDLLLVDVVMPVMDGRQLARRMLVLRPHMKVMLMSGYEGSGLAETGCPASPRATGRVTTK
jgi:CheY-like chemotaxis protein